MSTSDSKAENSGLTEDVLEKIENGFPFSVSIEAPISFGNEEITEITFKRRVLAKDLKKLPAGNMSIGEQMKLLSDITGTEMPKLDLLDYYDLQALLRIVNYFLSSSPKTGKVS